MAEVTLNIHGRNYGVACDDGQERRLVELGRYIDRKMKEISGAGAASNESHLMVLTALMLADEVFDLKEQGPGDSGSHAHEAAITEAIGQLSERIDSVTGRIQKV